MDGILVKELFISAGINVRSHCLAACQNSDHFVFASDGQAVVQAFPSLPGGRVVSVSDRHHSGPINILKRVTNNRRNLEGFVTFPMERCYISGDVFLSGGVDGRVVLYAVSSVDQVIRHLTTLDGVRGSVGTLCGTFATDRLVIMTSWVDGTDAGVRVWWLNQFNYELSMRNFHDICEFGTTFVIASDMQTMSNGKVLLAVGTTRRMIELYCETMCGKGMEKLLSVVGHEDWIHSMAFNQSVPVLLASAGQDTFVKLWRIEEEMKGVGGDEIGVTKNHFQIKSAEKTLSLSLSIEAVLAGHDDWVHSTMWDSEGRILLTSSSDKTIIIWKETCDRKLWSDSVRIGIVGGQAAGFFCAVFSPDAKEVVACSYHGGLYAWVLSEKGNMWNAATVCSGHTGAVRDVAWHPGGKFFISVGEDRTTRVYITQKDQNRVVEVARPQVHGHSMQCLSVVSSSVIVSGAEEKIFRVFEAPQTFAKSLCNISGLEMTQVFGDCTFSNYGARASALGLSNKAIEGSHEIQPYMEGHAHWEEAVFEAVPSELQAPPTEDCLQQNTLWPEVQKLYGHGYEVYAVSTNPGGTVIATSCKASQIQDAVIVLWDTSDWSKKFEIIGHQLTVTQLEWSPDGTRLLSVSRDRKAMLYREKDGDLNGFQYEKLWSSNKEHSRIIWSCCWCSDSKYFVTASRDMQVISWKCSDGMTAPICSFKCSQPAISVAVCCGTDMRNSVIATGLQDGSLLFLRLVDEILQPINTVFAPKIAVDSAILRIRVSPSNNSQLAVAGSDGKLRLLELKDTANR